MKNAPGIEFPRQVFPWKNTSQKCPQEKSCMENCSSENCPPCIWFFLILSLFLWKFSSMSKIMFIVNYNLLILFCLLFIFLCVYFWFSATDYLCLLRCLDSGPRILGSFIELMNRIEESLLSRYVAAILW